MTRLLALLAALLTGVAATAAPAASSETDGAADAEIPLFRPAGDDNLETFHWTHRPVIVFADSPNDPAFIEQMEMLLERSDELVLRDVVVLTDTSPADRSPLRQKLRPRGFMLVIAGKDGQISLRKPFPWSVREISRTIDKMPIRQREIRERTSADP